MIYFKKIKTLAVTNKSKVEKETVDKLGLLSPFVKATWPTGGKSMYLVYEGTFVNASSETITMLVLVYKGAPLSTNYRNFEGIEWTAATMNQFKGFSVDSIEDYSYFLCKFHVDGTTKTFFEITEGQKEDYDPEMCYKEYITAEEKLLLESGQEDKEFMPGFGELEVEVDAEQESEKEELVDPDGFMEKYFGKRIDSSGKVTSFMNKEGKYSMYEYVSVIRNNCTEKDWSLLKPFFGLTEETCNVLGELNTRFSLFEMLLELNKEFTAQAAVIDAKGSKEGAITIQKYTPVDHIQSRFSQSANNNEIFYEPNHYRRKGEMYAWANLFDHNQKIYYGADPGHFVPHARALAEMTKSFTAWVKEEDESYEALVPKTPYLGCDYSPDDFRFLADISISKKKDSPGKIRIIWNTKGGAQFSDKEELVAYFKVGPMGRLMGEGIPGVFKLYYAYQTDPSFADHWDNYLKKSVQARQDSANSEVYKNWIETSEDYYGMWGSNAKRSLYMTESVNEEATNEDYVEIVNALHDANRSMVETMSVDKSAFMKLIYQTNLFGSELLPITIINDLLFKGTDAELKYAHDLVSAVYLRSSDGCARPRCYPKDKVTYENLDNDKFDKKPNGVNSIIDMTDAKCQKIFIGGGTWIDKITPKEGNDGRAILYYDYEPELTRGSGSNLIHTPVPLDKDPQYRYAEKVLSGLKHNNGPDRIGVITSIRSLPRILRDYNVDFIYPAPFPMTLSVYVVASRNSTGHCVTMDQARDLAVMLLRKIRYIVEIYMFGAVDICDLVDRQLYLSHTKYMKRTFAAWWLLIRSRYTDVAEKQGSSTKRIRKGLTKMLRIDSNVATKIAIKGMGSRLDADLNRIAPKKKKK